MSQQLIDNDSALRLFFTEDVYLVPGEANPAVARQEVAATNEVPAPTPALVSQTVTDTTPTKVFDFKYKGKYGKGIVILGNNATTAEASTPEGMQVLANLMKAINVSGADVAVFNYAQYAGATFNDLYGFFKCKLILAFGVQPNDLDVASQGLHQFTQAGDTRIIFTHNLAQLVTDVDSKKVLWATLKTLI